MIGKRVVVLREINSVLPIHHFKKGEIGIVVAETKRTFNCKIRSLDTKRTAVGNVFIAESKLECIHFILEGDKAARVLFGG